MILCCTKGCHCDMSKWYQSPGAGWQMQHHKWQFKKPGDRCPEREWNGIGMRNGSCGGTLFDLDAKVDQLYQTAFSRRLSGNDKRIDSMNVVDMHRGVDARDLLRSLLLKGKKVTTGYFCTSIREVHDPVILHER